MIRRRAVMILLALSAGCVERTVSIQTEPEGATVFLNDQEVGASPVRVPFTWYGDYDIIVRKPGYQTLRTHHRLHAPWYQWPFIDLFAECLVPFTIHDDRQLPVLALEPQAAPAKEALLDAAQALRLEAGGGS
jgi:hypothetical protein